MSPAANTITGRVSTPAAYLGEAAKLFNAANIDSFPIWSKRVFPHMANFDRTVYVELTRKLVLRVREPTNGQILAESEPGKFDVLRVAPPISEPPPAQVPANFRNASEARS